jgi:diguanylate cyclase (GGDEF)-like protein
MPVVTSIACKYESFSALVKINDPELLLEVFYNQLAPDHTQELLIEIYEHFDHEWHKVTRNGCTTLDIDAPKRSLLEEKISPDETNIWFYETTLGGWFCAYKPLTSKQFALFLSITNPEHLIDEEYIQLLFSFYCHQLLSLEGTYRDSLTGLYNRRAFDQRMASLLNQQNLAPRQNQFNPSYFVIFDIDNFKQINDDYGHLYGDEVLAMVARIMTDSFREYDLLFRYGGEEFTAVLMNLDEKRCQKALERFRSNIEMYQFPRNNSVTISIGYTEFDARLTIDEIIDQADKALYLCKHRGRNQVNRYSR